MTLPTEGKRAEPAGEIRGFADVQHALQRRGPPLYLIGRRLRRKPLQWQIQAASAVR